MDLNIVKKPHECCKKEDVRDEIDRIDRQILDLFALRFEYVKAIVKFKSDKDAVIAQDRKDHVINQRAQWAKELGLDEQTFSAMFKILIDSNIEKEMELLKKKLQ
jgi:isochorismate pyruvate lyase